MIINIQSCFDIWQLHNKKFIALVVIIVLYYFITRFIMTVKKSGLRDYSDAFNLVQHDLLL